MRDAWFKACMQHKEDKEVEEMVLRISIYIVIGSLTLIAVVKYLQGLWWR